MKLYKRIVSFLLAVVTCFSFCLTSVFAAWYNDVGYYYTQSSLLQTVFSSLLTVGGTVVGANFGHPYLGELAGSAAAAGIYDLASWLAAGHTEDELYAAEEDFVSTLDNPVVSYDGGLFVRGEHYRCYAAGWYLVNGRYSRCGYYYCPHNPLGSGNTLTFDFYCGDSVSIISTNDLSVLDPSGIYSFIFDSFFQWQFTFPLRGIYYPVNDFFVSGLNKKNNPFPSSTGTDYPGHSRIETFSFPQVSASFGSTVSCPVPIYKYGGTDYVSELPKSSTRAAAIFQNITNYNSPDNSVNYFIGSLDKKGNIINIYLPDLYEESTKIFTEPVTGNQYQTTGWVYDYISRTYLLSLESGTFLIGSSDIDRIDLTYGDDALTISYYSNGSLITTDSYVYVISEERDCEHDYVSSITTQPTCTSPGLMTYTCSKCGSIYTEELPVVDHICTYSVTKEPSCTDPGTRVGVCSVCGTEVVQDLEPLGHDWLATEHTLTAYNLPPGAACPACRSTDFTSSYSSSSKDFDCTCSDCGKKWIEQAEVSLGKTVYTCSRCGETYTEVAEESSGLFAAIARFISNCIGWVTGKLKDLLHGISGINDVFSDFMISIKEKAKDYPAFLTAAISCLPEDFMSVIWFSIVALIVLAVWKKWLR